jgi:hypothetical protein
MKVIRLFDLMSSSSNQSLPLSHNLIEPVRREYYSAYRAICLCCDHTVDGAWIGDRASAM